MDRQNFYMTGEDKEKRKCVRMGRLPQTLCVCGSYVALELRLRLYRGRKATREGGTCSDIMKGKQDP